MKISKNLYFSTHFYNILLKKTKKFFINYLQQQINKIKKQTHTINYKNNKIK